MKKFKTKDKEEYTVICDVHDEIEAQIGEIALHTEKILELKDIALSMGLRMENGLYIKKDRVDILSERVKKEKEKRIKLEAELKILKETIKSLKEELKKR